MKSIPFKQPLMSRLLLIIVCALLISHTGFAQTKYLVDNYWVENYSKKQGLPEDIVINITQDRKGYIWMTTPYNLVRFDGYQFTIFNPGKQFPGLYIHFYPGLIEDAKGIIWIASNDKGLFCFNPVTQKFNRYYADGKENSLSSNAISSVIEDDDANIWIGTSNGLDRLSIKGDSISILKFGASYPEKLLTTVDRIIAQNQPLAGFSKVGDLEKKETTIEIK